MRLQVGAESVELGADLCEPLFHARGVAVARCATQIEQCLAESAGPHAGGRPPEGMRAPQEFLAVLGDARIAEDFELAPGVLQKRFHQFARQTEIVGRPLAQALEVKHGRGICRG